MYKFRPYQFLLCLFGLLFVACANPGSGPDGGPYDETPPRILHMSPALGQMNAKAKRISIAFDEYIKVENITEKVTISPPQQNQPEINVSGRNITIELQDSLLPNTTYTVDFSDAISDNNEGNPLGNFTYYFSTGESVDTLQVSGHVLSADDLEPIKGILVG
ncbi:MAG: Ig-like domain-containing protein, partial [Bacteroidales bacterium]|nr:Ig-like domain-containing protein [Bacteroidales bacterium]